MSSMTSADEKYHYMPDIIIKCAIFIKFHYQCKQADAGQFMLEKLLN